MKNHFSPLVLIIVFQFLFVTGFGQNRAPSCWLKYPDNFKGDIIINTVRVASPSPLYTYYCTMQWNAGMQNEEWRMKNAECRLQNGELNIRLNQSAELSAFDFQIIDLSGKILKTGKLKQRFIKRFYQISILILFLSPNYYFLFPNSWAISQNKVQNLPRIIHTMRMMPHTRLADNFYLSSI